MYLLVASADQDGRLNGQDAVEFFQRSGLPRDILSKVKYSPASDATVTGKGSRPADLSRLKDAEFFFSRLS